MQYTTREAKAKLSELLNRADAGEDVLITRPGRAPIRLTKVEVPAVRVLGSCRGKAKLPPDSAWDPMTDEEANAFWEGK